MWGLVIVEFERAADRITVHEQYTRIPCYQKKDSEYFCCGRIKFYNEAQKQQRDVERDQRPTEIRARKERGNAF